jgi:Ca2+-transporting ATPase
MPTWVAVVAISEGRRIYANVRRFLLFGMSGGAAEIMVMLVGAVPGNAATAAASSVNGYRID